MNEQDFYTSFLCEQLRDVRLQQRVSVEEIAIHVGVKSEDVTRWENSPMPTITLAQVAEYAQACGYSPLEMELRSMRKI